MMALSGMTLSRGTADLQALGLGAAQDHIAVAGFDLQAEAAVAEAVGSDQGRAAAEEGIVYVCGPALHNFDRIAYREDSGMARVDALGRGTKEDAVMNLPVLHWAASVGVLVLCAVRLTATTGHRPAMTGPLAFNCLLRFDSHPVEMENELVTRCQSAGPIAWHSFALVPDIPAKAPPPQHRHPVNPAIPIRHPFAFAVDQPEVDQDLPGVGHRQAGEGPPHQPIPV